MPAVPRPAAAARLLAIAVTAAPLTPSTAASRVSRLFIEAASSRVSAPRHQPLRYRIRVGIGPGPLFAFPEQLPDRVVLLGDRLLGVHRDEVEDHGQRFVLTDDPRDEPLV